MNANFCSLFKANRPGFWGGIEQTAIIRGWQPTTLAVSRPWRLQGQLGINKHVLVESRGWEWILPHFCRLCVSLAIAELFAKAPSARISDWATGFRTVRGGFFTFNNVGFGCAGSTGCICCWLLLLPDPPL